jgi:hypothetical protein
VLRAGHAEPLLQRLAAHPDRVDLVDEHDALAAPLASQLLRLVRQVLDDESVHADEHLREAGTRDRDERAVEAGCDRLRDHRLACSRRSEEQQPPLTLAAGLLELLSRLPERDHARDLLFGLGLTADVVDLHAPAGVARLVAADAADRHQQERTEQDEHVDEQQQW